VLLGQETDRFCTVVLIRLRQSEGSWVATVGSGGHPLPLLVRDEAQPQVIGREGSLLGVLETIECHDREVVLRPGDAVVLYTDGVTEGRRGPDFFGELRLTAAIAGATGSAASLTEGILGEVLDFQGGDPRDDVVLVAIHVP
jgi:phosphoserine phosphatase RsbU/P